MRGGHPVSPPAACLCAPHPLAATASFLAIYFLKYKNNEEESGERVMWTQAVFSVVLPGCGQRCCWLALPRCGQWAFYGVQTVLIQNMPVLADQNFT